RGLAERLGLPASKYTVTFQSRLTQEWVQPFTDVTLDRMREEGKYKELVVFCPAFVADCLETLEEVGMGLKETFEQAGEGRELTLVPSLNAETVWVDAVEQIVRETLSTPHLPVLSAAPAAM